MSTSLIMSMFSEFAMEEIHKAEMEIEKCWYGKIANMEDLLKADEKERIEQWEIRSPSGVIRVRAYNDEKYELCVKRFIENENGKQTIEKEMDIDKEFFLLMKSLSPAGTLKDRYEFKVPDSDMEWEIDVYVDSEGKPINWCKVDLEIESKDQAIPEFPIAFERIFDQDNCSDDEKEFKRQLFDRKYNRYNDTHIQQEFKD